LNLNTLSSFSGRILLMDRIDRKILAELEQDGRLTVTELAARVQLSVSPCHRRLRALERLGAIRGYRAIVDAASVGLSFEALVFASLHQGDRDTVAPFGTLSPRFPRCSRLSACSAIPTTGCAWSPSTWPPTSISTTLS
jgi:DNA-binding Lrp family transcriptional regulator